MGLCKGGLLCSWPQKDAQAIESIEPCTGTNPLRADLIISGRDVSKTGSSSKHILADNSSETCFGPGRHFRGAATVSVL